MQPLISLLLQNGRNKSVLGWNMRVVISYVFPHTLSILGPLCTKYTLKWSTIFPMQITSMHLHVMISCECLVTHRAWKCPNLLLQGSPPPCNNTSIIRISPRVNFQGPLTLLTLWENLTPSPTYTMNHAILI